MQPNPYAPYPYPTANGGQMPVRYMIPNGYRQSSPPFANQSFDRYAAIPPAAVRPPPGSIQPIRYPPGYYPPNMRMPPGSSPRPQQQQPKPNEQLQPPQPYYYNPYGPNGASPAGSLGPRGQAPKKGAKEFKDNAFTIAPDGAHSEAIKGLVSNNNINDLLKHKGTKIKVSKIYRISKTKPDIPAPDSSDDDLPLPIQQPRSQPTLPPQQQQIQQQIERPLSSSSSASHCSTCSNCSCTDCRDRKQSHTYDDCPDCRAERNREQARRQRRK
jgi:hypothetical protein